jgi:serine/threonine protein kinase
MRVFIHAGDSTSISTTIDTRSKLGRGATATVYRVIHEGKPFAAKIYHDSKTLNTKKILAMLANVPENSISNLNGLNYPKYAWPLALIKNDKGAGIGYLMPLVDPDNSYTLDHYYDQVLLKKLNRPNERALNYKLEVALNLSAAIAALHKNQHYFIDFKPQNIRVFRETHLVTLIDCDGFSIQGNGERYPAEMLSSDYIAPEAYRLNKAPQELSESQDRYALAVILFQLLNRGTHPFQGIINSSTVNINTNDEKAAAGLYPHGVVTNLRIKPRPQSTHHLWDAETRSMFDKAFTTGSPSSRPTARDWIDHFKQLLDGKGLVRCLREPADLEHISFRGMGCPACYLKRLPAFVPAVPAERQPPVPQRPSPPSTPVSVSNTRSEDGWKWWAAIIVFFILIQVFFSSNKTKVEVAPSNQGNEPISSIPPVVDSPIANAQVKNFTFSEKMDLLYNERGDKGGNQISLNTLNTQFAKEKFNEVSREIINEIKKLDAPINADGQYIYSNFQLPNITGITFNGFTEKNCGGIDTGKISYCLVNRDVTPTTLTCQVIETSQKISEFCIHAVEK